MRITTIDVEKAVKDLEYFQRLAKMDNRQEDVTKYKRAVAVIQALSGRVRKSP